MGNLITAHSWLPWNEGGQTYCDRLSIAISHEIYHIRSAEFILLCWKPVDWLVGGRGLIGQFEPVDWLVGGRGLIGQFEPVMC